LMGGEFGGEWGIRRLQGLGSVIIQKQFGAIGFRTLGQQFNQAIVRNGELTPKSYSRLKSGFWKSGRNSCCNCFCLATPLHE